MSWDGHTPVGLLPERAAQATPDRLALSFQDRRWTFRQLAAEIDDMARGYLALGLAPGDKVALWLNNGPAWMFHSFALAKIGAVQVPVNTRFRTADLEYLLQQADCVALVTHDRSGPVDYLGMVRELVPGQDTAASPRLPQLRHVIVESALAHRGTLGADALRAMGQGAGTAQLDARARAVDADDNFTIMYTSGTSGFPKGVMRSHRQSLGHHQERLRALGVTPSDVYLNYLPLFHVFGYVDGPITSMLCGSRQVLMERFDPELAVALIESERVTMLGGFETHLNDLSAAQEKLGRDLSSLRAGLFATGTESAARALVRARRVLAPLKTVSVYGTTEIGANVTLSRLDSTQDQALHTSGMPSQDCEVRIVDPATLQPLPPMGLGEIQIRSTGRMQGYYHQPEETARCYTSDGWYRSGDIGCLREDGYLHFMGRIKDMLKIGGENVDPMEIEAFLLRLPGVREVAVVGCPHERLSEVPVAYIVPSADAQLTEEQVLAFAAGRIASFKIPRHVRFLPALPMTASGKVQKEKLRAQVREQGLGAP